MSSSSIHKTTHSENHLKVFALLCTKHLHVQMQVEAVMYVAWVLVLEEDRCGERTTTGLRGAQFLCMVSAWRTSKDCTPFVYCALFNKVSVHTPPYSMQATFEHSAVISNP